MNNDAVRAAIISFIQSALPLLEIAGVIHLTSDQVAAVMLFVNNAVTLAFLIKKPSR